MILSCLLSVQVKDFIFCIENKCKKVSIMYLIRRSKIKYLSRFIKDISSIRNKWLIKLVKDYRN